jgi:short subunit dehydrogenase-like uncharacterized protein
MYDFIIYGSYGFTGNLIAELAVSKGLKPLLAGRNKALLQAQAERLNLPFEAVSLDGWLKELLLQTKAVIHAAGPYSHTAKPMLEACLAAGVHYLDITGELEVFEWLQSQGARAKQAGIAVLPGVGFDVVPTDCLAAYLKQRLPSATHLALAFKGVGGALSRGTARTMVENIGNGGMIRENGMLKPVPAAYQTRTVPLANKNREVVSIPWGDVSMAYHSTGIPNIITYTAVAPSALKFMKASRYFGWLLETAPAQSMLRNWVDKNATGPSLSQQATGNAYIWGEVRDASGKTATASLKVMEAYKLTAHTALEAALRVLAGQVPAGFHTPSKAFGPDYILGFEGSERVDL